MMNNRYRSFRCLFQICIAIPINVVYLFSSVACGGEATRPVAPPRSPIGGAIATAPTFLTPPTRTISLGHVRITFGQTTMSEVLSQIGAGEIAEAGDGMEHAYWICYSVDRQSRLENVWLLSSGELGGEEHVIYGVTANIDQSRSGTNACPRIPQKFKSITLGGGIWIGASENEVRRRYGKPSAHKGEWLIYSSRQQLRDDPRANAWKAKSFSEFGDLLLRIKDGNVVELWATVSSGA